MRRFLIGLLVVTIAVVLSGVALADKYIVRAKTSKTSAFYSIMTNRVASGHPAYRKFAACTNVDMMFQIKCKEWMSEEVAKWEREAIIVPTVQVDPSEFDE